MALNAIDGGVIPPVAADNISFNVSDPIKSRTSFDGFTFNTLCILYIYNIKLYI
jgi:hypothetical protein